MSDHQKRLKKLEAQAEPETLGGVLVIHPDGHCVLNGRTSFPCRADVPDGAYLVIEAPVDAATWSARAVKYYEETGTCAR